METPTKIPEEVKLKVHCENECPEAGAQKCADDENFLSCGDYDEDDCLEWKMFSCPDNICRGGRCIFIPKTCEDGTLPGQCSTISRPKYCEKRTLIDKPSLCGCPLGYEFVENYCIRKLFSKCGVIFEGSKDYSKTINFLIVPADIFHKEDEKLRPDPVIRYSNDLDAFVADATQNVNDFLSVEPMNKYKNVFNFYYSPIVIECIFATKLGVSDECKLWKEAANLCDIPYDVAIVLERKTGGGEFFGRYIISSAHQISTFVHEIGHLFGFLDEVYFDSNLPRQYLLDDPAFCTNLDCCGGNVCPFNRRWASDARPLELGGPDCCIHLGTVNNINYYKPNEQSIMIGSEDYNALKFTRVEKAYLNELFTKISSLGKDSVRCGQTFKLEKYCRE